MSYGVARYQCAVPAVLPLSLCLCNMSCGTEQYIRQKCNPLYLLGTQCLRLALQWHSAHRHMLQPHHQDRCLSTISSSATIPFYAHLSACVKPYLLARVVFRMPCRPLWDRRRITTSPQHTRTHLQLSKGILHRIHRPAQVQRPVPTSHRIQHVSDITAPGQPCTDSDSPPQLSASSCPSPYSAG